MNQDNSTSSFLRVLSRKDVVALAFGAMIGWSWVVLTGTWITSAGVAGAIIAFLVGGGAIAIVGLTYAELASALPFAGGEHVYSERALGYRASFICTWAIILGYMSVIAFEAVALPTVMSSLVPGLDIGYLWTIAGWEVHATWVGVGILGAVVMTTLNVLGVKMVAIVQTTVVMLILVVGFFFFTGSTLSGNTSNLDPLFIDGLNGIAIVLVMVPFMFVGFDIIPQAAEEIDLPFRDIGTALILSVVMAIAWYALVILGVGMVMNGEQLAGADLVTAEANAIIYGDLGGTILLLTGLAGIITSWNALIVGASRAIYAMAKDGMLPHFLGEIHPRYHTPRNAILLIGLLSVISPFFGRPALVWLVNAGGLGIVVAYAFVALSFIALRKNEPELARPYTAPGGIATGYLALVLSIGIGTLYFPGSPSALVWPHEWGIIFFWIILGALLFGLSRLNPQPQEA
ncbi:MAG: APC family permease [Proteobacteria bacterium]|nr:APC family permease [Pseudomonadota bacterium]MDA0928684.1 APC family permease [Pseudomonadota bacterium]